MTEIVLYGVAVSAFVAKVRIALDWKGLAFDERTPPGGYGSAAYRAIVAAGSVPGAMIDGRPLHDANAIIEYLETLQSAPPLFPVDPYVGARARALHGAATNERYVPSTLSVAPSGRISALARAMSSSGCAQVGAQRR